MEHFSTHGERADDEKSPSDGARISDPHRSTGHRAPGVWRRRFRRIVVTAAVLLTVGAVGVTATTYFVGRDLADNVQRVESVFQGIDPTQRPSPIPETSPGGRGRTILAVGSDLRAPGQTTGRNADFGSGWGHQRTDTIMLIRFDADENSAAVVSIPRDSWVPIPGHGHNKINAAYPLGGPSLLIQTVEKLTQVRVDNFMIIDFAGFRSIVDALGGVQVQVAEAVTGPDNIHFRQGANNLDGTAALAYVRQRKGLPGGDLDRVRRQQNVLRAILTKVSSTSPGGDPRRTYRLLDAVTRAVTIDDSFTAEDLREFTLDAVRLDRDSVWFVTAATRGGGWEGDQSVVYLDDNRNSDLWTALREQTMSRFVAEGGASLLATVPR